MPQLRALLGALGGQDAAAIGVSLHVISGEEEVCQAATGPGVTSELIAGNVPGLTEQIVKAQPDILHLLCHGGVVAGVRTLAFGRISDFDQPTAEESGSVRLPVDELTSALDKVDPWLVVLNACETAGAEASSGSRPLAHELVYNGVPAAIGMRRLIDLTNANRFSEELYPSLLRVAGEALKPSGAAGSQQAVRIIDWASALSLPRRVLGEPDPSLRDSWTDPVLYVQEAPLRVFLPTVEIPSDQYAQVRARLDKFLGLRAVLGPDATAGDLIRELDTRIAELKAVLGQADA
jgi:hypothetical protein